MKRNQQNTNPFTTIKWLYHGRAKQRQPLVKCAQYLSHMIQQFTFRKWIIGNSIDLFEYHFDIEWWATHFIEIKFNMIDCNVPGTLYLGKIILIIKFLNWIWKTFGREN